MRAALVAISLLLSLADLAPVQASTDPFGASPPPKPPPQGAYAGGGREGGDTLADAVVIAAIPFQDTGVTCGYANDYDALCPYTGSTAPDVVYSYSPSADLDVTIDLCNSQYDTKVYVWEDVEGNVVACNDDAGCGYSGWQSKIADCVMHAGHTYYIVIDGYGDSCGTYDLGIAEFTPCHVECAPNDIPEGEPPCYTDYFDSYDSGCNGAGWIQIMGCETICGKSGTYLYNGNSYRDTDWYTVTGSNGLIITDCIAEFPLQFILIYYTNCNDLQYELTTADPCQNATLSYYIANGQEAWIWVGPSMFNGVACESTYRLHVSGLQYPPGTPGACCLADGTCVYEEAAACEADQGQWIGFCDSCDPSPCTPTPVKPTTWGAIKQRYR